MSDYDSNPKRNRPAYNPGGMQCERCDEIFIGADWHAYCGICVEQVSAEEAEARAKIKRRVSHTTGERPNG